VVKKKHSEKLLNIENTIREMYRNWVLTVEWIYLAPDSIWWWALVNSSIKGGDCNSSQVAGCCCTQSAFLYGTYA
jgi:hypothetical protein